MDDQPPPNRDAGQDEDNAFKFIDLYQAWLNEKLAPELLPYQTELMHDQLDLCNIQEEQIRDPPTHGEEESLFANARDHFLQHDLARYHWLIRSYLRLRIKKLENFARYYVDHPRFLSPEEQKLVGELQRYEEEQYEQMCLKSLDSRVRSGLITSEIMPKPDLDTFVCIEVIAPETRIYANSDTQAPPTQGTASQGPNLSFTQEPVDLRKGDKYFILYSYVRDNLLSNPPSVILI